MEGSVAFPAERLPYKTIVIFKEVTSDRWQICVLLLFFFPLSDKGSDFAFIRK